MPSSLTVALFASVIADRIRRGFHVQEFNGDWQYVEGIGYDIPQDPIRIFGLLDCSLFETETPGTGPRGQYEAAARHEDHDIEQEAILFGVN